MTTATTSSSAATALAQIRKSAAELNVPVELEPLVAIFFEKNSFFTKERSRLLQLLSFLGTQTHQIYVADVFYIFLMYHFEDIESYSKEIISLYMDETNESQVGLLRDLYPSVITGFTKAGIQGLRPYLVNKEFDDFLPETLGFLLNHFAVRGSPRGVSTRTVGDFRNQFALYMSRSNCFSGPSPNKELSQRATLLLTRIVINGDISVVAAQMIEAVLYRCFSLLPLFEQVESLRSFHSKNRI